MKKVLSLTLAVLMVLSLFACGQKDTTTSPSASPSASDDASSASSAPIAADSNIGRFDPSTDYSKNTRYKVVYMMSQAGVLYDMFNKAFASWAERANCDYSSFSANNDNDLFVTTIETMASQGVNGFLFDADTTIYPRVVEVVNDLNIPWMTGMAEALDSDGNRAHPVVGFDQTKFGVDMANYTIDYAKKNWPDAKPEEIGMLSIDFSLSPQVHERTLGAQKTFKEAGFPDANFITVDSASTGSFSAEIGANLSTPAFASNPNIKYWLVCAAFDDFADGATAAAKQAGIEKNCVITACGGSSLIAHWDAGEDSCWKSAIYSAQVLFGEGIFFALYAFMNGDATPETIFPEWIDHSTNQKYAYVNLPTFTIEKDNYKEYLEWVDSYSGMNTSPYDADYKGTEFDSKGTPPASYAG